MPLTLQQVQAAIADAHERAAKLGVPVTVAIVDEDGHLPARGRMAGAPLLSAQIAQTKGDSVALLRQDGTSLYRFQEGPPAFSVQVDRAAPMPILVGAGSVLIRQAGAFLGAVGTLVVGASGAIGCTG